ncbi:MAG: hypothetical protein AAB473_03440 [Patescibacteria group bacterium]
MNDFVNQQNARPGGYDKVIAEITEQKICPFCPQHLNRIHTKPMEQRMFWIITDNQFPYKPTKHHKLLIHRTHIEHISQISSEAWIELGEILKEQTAIFKMSAGSMFMRFGDMRFTGSTVSHLHCQLLQSDPDDPSYDPKIGVFTRLG